MVLVSSMHMKCLNTKQGFGYSYTGQVAMPALKFYNNENASIITTYIFCCIL